MFFLNKHLIYLFFLFCFEKLIKTLYLNKVNMKKKNYMKLSHYIFIIIITLATISPVSIMAYDNTFYFKLIDLTGIAPFSNNITLQYEKKLLDNVYLLTEVSQENQNINNNSALDEGFAIGLSIPTTLFLQPYIGYKYATRKYNDTSIQTEDIRSIFTQLNIKQSLNKNSLLIFYGRVIVEKIDITSETQLNYDIGISYGIQY